MVRIQQADFDPGEELERLRANDPGVGALASFVGLVRDSNEGAGVAQMTLEHYPGMTERAIERIEMQARERWQVKRTLVVHRVGSLQPGDRIVLVAVAGAHRGDALAACEYIIDYLKTRAPFWKKERTGEGERWVEARASDDAAAARWAETS